MLNELKVQQILDSTNAKRTDELNQYVGLCPIHDDKNESLSIKADNDKVNPLVFCHAGCDQTSLINHFMDRGMWNRPIPKVSHPKAARLVKLGVPLLNDSIGHKYLQNRRIDLPVEGLQPAFFIPNALHPELEECRPALVFPVQDIQLNVTGAQRVYLEENSQKVKNVSAKLSAGQMKGSAYKTGFIPNEIVHLAEGPETALTVYQALKEPVWATMSANNLKNQTFPKTVKEIHIWADKDQVNPKTKKAPGQNEAEKAAEKYTVELGVFVYIHYPPFELKDDQKSIDWNDCGFEFVMEEKQKKKAPHGFPANLKSPFNVEYDLKDFDHKLMPEPLREYVIDNCKANQIPLEFVFFTILTSLTTVIADKVRVESPDDGYNYLPALWTMIVSPPSNKKTTAMKLGMIGLKSIVSHIKEVARNNEKTAKGEISLLKKKNKIIEHQIDLLLKQMEPDHPQVKEQMKIKTHNDRQIKKIASSATFKPYIKNDITIEKFLEVMSEHNGSYLMFNDELSQWLGMMKKDYQATSRKIYLSLWGGISDYIMERKRSESNCVVNWASINVVGAIQPNVVKSLFTHENEGDGFTERFQAILFPNNGKKKEIIYHRPAPALKQKIIDLFMSIYNLEDLGESGLGGFQALKFSLESVDLWERFVKKRNHLQFKLEERGEMSLSSHLMKMDTTFITLCACLHSIERFKGVTSKEIQPGTVKNAEALTWFLWENVQKAHLVSRVTSNEETLRIMMDYFASGVVENGTTLKGLWNAKFRRGDYNNFMIAINRLADCGHIKLIGGKDRILINPMAGE